MLDFVIHNWNSYWSLIEVCGITVINQMYPLCKVPESSLGYLIRISELIVLEWVLKLTIRMHTSFEWTETRITMCSGLVAEECGLLKLNKFFRIWGSPFPIFKLNRLFELFSLYLFWIIKQHFLKLSKLPRENSLRGSKLHPHN